MTSSPPSLALRLASAVFVLLSPTLAACSRTTPKVVSHPAIAPASAAPSTSTSAIDAASDAGVARCLFDALHPTAQIVDVAAWRKAHGAKNTIASKECWDAGDHVGVPASPGLLCLVDVPAKGSVAVDRRAQLHRLDGDRLDIVWEETVATYANWLELTPTLSANDATLVLHDASGCEGAIRESHEKDLATVGIDGLTALLRRACDRRGAYAWSGKRYERVTDASKIAAADREGDPCAPDPKPVVSIDLDVP